MSTLMMIALTTCPTHNTPFATAAYLPDDCSWFTCLTHLRSALRAVCRQELGIPSLLHSPSPYPRPWLLLRPSFTAVSYEDSLNHSCPAVEPQVVYCKMKHGVISSSRKVCSVEQTCSAANLVILIIIM